MVFKFVLPVLTIALCSTAAYADVQKNACRVGSYTGGRVDVSLEFDYRQVEITNVIKEIFKAEGFEEMDNGSTHYLIDSSRSLQHLTSVAHDTILVSMHGSKNSPLFADPVLGGAAFDDCQSISGQAVTKFVDLLVKHAHQHAQIQIGTREIRQNGIAKTEKFVRFGQLLECVEKQEGRPASCRTSFHRAQ